MEKRGREERNNLFGLNIWWNLNKAEGVLVGKTVSSALASSSTTSSDIAKLKRVRSLADANPQSLFGLTASRLIEDVLPDLDRFNIFGGPIWGYFPQDHKNPEHRVDVRIVLLDLHDDGSVRLFTERECRPTRALGACRRLRKQLFEPVELVVCSLKHLCQET